jgi:hypothetical protein
MCKLNHLRFSFKRILAIPWYILCRVNIKKILEGTSIPADFMWQGNNIHTVGKIKIDRALYDIKYNSAKFFAGLGDKIISDDFEVSLDLITQ